MAQYQANYIVISRIKQALVNSLSYDATLRDNALHFLTEDCESDPNFQLDLLQIIRSFSLQAQS